MKCQTCNDKGEIVVRSKKGTRHLVSCPDCPIPNIKAKQYFGKCYVCDFKKRFLYNARGLLINDFTCFCDITELIYKVEQFKVALKLDGKKNILFNIGQEFYICKKISPQTPFPNSEIIIKSCGKLAKVKNNLLKVDR